MGILRIGAGSISTTIPAGAAGPERFDGADATPLVSGNAASAPIPTNDWWSSLIFRYFNQPMSAPLYADPIALRADAAGLQIGYQSTVTYIDAPGLQVSDNIKYQYTFAPGLHVGLEGLGGASVTVADYGDWTVTADWQGGGELAAYAKSLGGDGTLGPLAVFTGSSGNDDFVRTVSTMLRPGRRLRTFSTIHAARRWLDRAPLGDRFERRPAAR